MNFRRTDRPASVLTESSAAQFALCYWAIAGIVGPVIVGYGFSLWFYIGG